MAYTLCASVAATFNTHLVGGEQFQVVKPAFGASASACVVTSSVGLPVNLVQDNLAGNLDINIAASGVTLDASVTGLVSLTGSVSAIVQGHAAHDAAVSGNPVLGGFEARTTNPTAVADGDAVRGMADDLGRQVITLHAPRDLVVDNHLTSLSASTTQTLLTAGAAGVFRDLTSIVLSNFSSTVANVIIFDGAVGGTERFRFDLAADGGGAVINFTVPFKQASAATPWAIKSTELDVAVTVQAVQTV